MGVKIGNPVKLWGGQMAGGCSGSLVYYHCLQGHLSQPSSSLRNGEFHRPYHKETQRHKEWGMVPGQRGQAVVTITLHANQGVQKKFWESREDSCGHAQEKGGAGTLVSLAFPVSLGVVCNRNEQRVLGTSRPRRADDRQIQDEI